MSVEGRLTIDLDSTAQGMGRARIASSRPIGVTRVFVGEPAVDVVKTIPLMFSVCGLAQGAAAAQACERALGINAAPETQRVRRLLVLVEMLREHLLRAAMDWRSLLKLPPQPESTLRVMRLGTSAKRTLDPEATAFAIGAAAARDPADISPMIAEAVRVVEELVLGEPVGSWRQRQTLSDLEDWGAAGATAAQQLVSMVLSNGWADAGRAEIDFLPELPAEGLGDLLLGDESAVFVAAPTWEGRPRETSVLSRHADHPLVSDVMRVHGCSLLARLACRLVETAEAPRAMANITDADRVEAKDAERQLASMASSGRGIAHVEAARGRLVHGVEIVDEMVRRYAILAPTEWNFHAAGGAARGLADIAVRAGDVRTLASLFVSSVDPCVGYEVRVH